MDYSKTKGDPIDRVMDPNRTRLLGTGVGQSQADMIRTGESRARAVAAGMPADQAAACVDPVLKKLSNGYTNSNASESERRPQPYFVQDQGLMGSFSGMSRKPPSGRSR